MERREFLLMAAGAPIATLLPKSEVQRVPNNPLDLTKPKPIIPGIKLLHPISPEVQEKKFKPGRFILVQKDGSILNLGTEFSAHKMGIRPMARYMDDITYDMKSPLFRECQQMVEDTEVPYYERTTYKVGYELDLLLRDGSRHPYAVLTKSAQSSFSTYLLGWVYATPGFHPYTFGCRENTAYRGHFTYYVPTVRCDLDS